MLLRLINSAAQRKLDSGLKMLIEPAMYWPVASQYYKKHSHNLSILFYLLSRASFLPFSLFLRQPLTKKKKRGKEKLKMETHLNAKLSLSHAAAAAASWKCFQRMNFWLKCQPGVNIANKIGLSCIFHAGAVRGLLSRKNDHQVGCERCLCYTCCVKSCLNNDFLKRCRIYSSSHKTSKIQQTKLYAGSVRPKKSRCPFHLSSCQRGQNRLVFPMLCTSTRWFQSTFSNLCPLYSNQRH